jgi:hypothetical protein
MKTTWLVLAYIEKRDLRKIRYVINAKAQSPSAMTTCVSWVLSSEYRTNRSGTEYY